LPPLPTKASTKAAIPTAAVIAVTMTDTATVTATALTLAVTVLSKKYENLKALAIEHFALFPKKKRSDVELGLNRIYWYSSTYRSFMYESYVGKNRKSHCT
jgi:hypothetical protein